MMIKPVIDRAKLAAIDAEISAYVKSMHGDDAGFDAKAAHVDELVRARMRVMGLPKDEIARIEQKSEAVVDEQVNAEIEDFLQRLPKHVARRWRRQWKRGAR